MPTISPPIISGLPLEKEFAATVRSGGGTCDQSDLLRRRLCLDGFSGWTGRIEAHNAYIDVMEPNNAVLRNPLDVDSTFHIRIYDYFIDFHEDREIVDDLEFTPSDVEADDWTEDIKRCLEENGWRLDSKIGTDSDDSDLLVFDCVKA